MPLADFQQTTLQEYMQQQGCPLCRAIWLLDTKQFDWYVNDGVLDEETQQRVRRSLGFCVPHTLSLTLIEGSEFLWSHLGSCMVSTNVIEQELLPDLQKFLTTSDHNLLYALDWKVFSPLRHLVYRSECPLCFDHRQNEATYVEQFIQSFSSDGAFQQTYAKCDGLCIPHIQHVQKSLSEPHHLLKDIGAQNLERSVSQAPAPLSLDQLKQWLGMLYGMDTLLWSDYVSRVTVEISDTHAPFCLVCQDEARETTLALAAFLDHFEGASHTEESRNTTLSLCNWHAWWVFKQCAIAPALLVRLEPILRVRDTRMLQHIQESDNVFCHLCIWASKQEAVRFERLHSQVHDLQQQVQLCLWHTNIALRSVSNERDAERLVLALFHSAFLLSKRLEAYVRKCSQHLQDQMQPDELTVWFDAVQWFVGSENAQFLL